MGSDAPSEREYCERLARALRRAGLETFAALALEAAAPLAPVVAQLAHVASPLMGGREGGLGLTARVLEDPSMVSELVGRLRQDSRR